MNWLKASLIAITTFGVVAVAVPSLVTGPSNYERAVEASVRVGNVCSGTVIDDPILEDGNQLTVLTAKHCIRQGMGQEFIVHKDGVLMTMTVTWLDENSDSALLQAEMPEVPWTTAVISHELPSWGSVVYSISHPAITYGEVMSRGYLGELLTIPPVPGYTQFMGAGPYLIASVATIGGSSGSGLFNEDFELIATLTGGTGEMTNVWTPVLSIDALQEPVDDNA